MTMQDFLTVAKNIFKTEGYSKVEILLDDLNLTVNYYHVDLGHDTCTVVGESCYDAYKEICSKDFNYTLISESRQNLHIIEDLQSKLRSYKIGRVLS